METKECMYYKDRQNSFFMELNKGICKKDGRLTNYGCSLREDEKGNWYCPKGKGIIEYKTRNVERLGLSSRNVRRNRIRM
jgi:hypothetical protein